MSIYSQADSATNVNYIVFQLRDNAGVETWKWTVVSAGTSIIFSEQFTALTTNIWYHIALVRSGNNFLIFQNGSQVGSTVVDSDAVPDFAYPLEIGRYGGLSAGQYLNGWLDEFRVSKGVARWTSNFTPPAAPYSPSEEPGYGVFYDYNYAPFLSTAAGADDWGDKANYRTKDLMRAISLTIPHNLFVEPTRVLRFAARLSDARYETGMVMHQGDENHSVTVVEAATTLDLDV
jgi:hypothetical protein